MPTLETRLKDDIKTAMKSGAKDELELLRTLLSDIKNVAIAQGLERAGFSDEFVTKSLRRGVKTRTESADLYQSAGRQDLEQKERFQIEVLRRYLPAEMGVAELELIVDVVIVELGATTKKEMGAVMKEVMVRTSGRADGKQVSGIVAGRLA
jgi:uncharacterized protein YqeY